MNFLGRIEMWKGGLFSEQGMLILQSHKENCGGHTRLGKGGGGEV